MDFLSLYNYVIILLFIPLIALSFVAIKYVRTGMSRLIVSFLFVVAAAYTFIIPLEFTSYPKPVSIEWYGRNVEEAQVLWSGVHPDTKKIYLLLHWEGQDYPRYYALDNFEDKEGEMRMGEELQDAMRKSEEAKQKGGTGTITMKYPFQSMSEREKQLAEDSINRQSEILSSDNADRNNPGAGYESDDSTFSVEPPPPPNPEKQ